MTMKAVFNDDFSGFLDNCAANSHVQRRQGNELSYIEAHWEMIYNRVLPRRFCALVVCLNACIIVPGTVGTCETLFHDQRV